MLKDQTYPMNRPNLGHAIVINNVHSDVPGSQVDVELLVECYKTMGFNVQVHNDCDTQVIGVSTIRKYDAFLSDYLKDLKFHRTK